MLFLPDRLVSAIGTIPDGKPNSELILSNNRTTRIYTFNVLYLLAFYHRPPDIDYWCITHVSTGDVTVIAHH